MTATKRRVAYYYDNEVGNYTFGPNHVMKPQRMRMVHNLVVNYGMHKHMEIMRPNRATFLQMTQFHTDEYIDFLKTVCAENAKDLHEHTAKYLSGEDCPVWEGIYEFCSISAGGSIAAANKLNHGEADIGINWSGGLHHAKKNEASGFCYVNDNVLGILELLRYHQRVVYIDIDVHHGDGVEEAFYLSDRVMTVSFHKHGDFFPGTGEIRDIGIGKGRNYAVNVPLRDGINDESYKFIFRSVIQNVMDHYRPGAVWLQCGTDSLAGDRLGCFNLSMHGHAACVEFMRSFNVPLVVVGGGGYTIRNVARTWTYETAVCLGIEPDPMLPFHDYYEYYGPDYRLDVPSNNMDNHNDRKFLEKIRNRIADTLRQIPHAPSVQLQSVPRDVSTEDEDEEDEEAMNTDIRISQRQRDAYIFPDNEFADLDDGLGATSKSHTPGQFFNYDRTYGFQPSRTASANGQASCYFGEDLEDLPPSLSAPMYVGGRNGHPPAVASTAAAAETSSRGRPQPPSTGPPPVVNDSVPSYYPPRDSSRGTNSHAGQPTYRSARDMAYPPPPGREGGPIPSAPDADRSNSHMPYYNHTSHHSTPRYSSLTNPAYVSYNSANGSSSGAGPSHIPYHPPAAASPATGSAAPPLPPSALAGAALSSPPPPLAPPSGSADPYGPSAYRSARTLPNGSGMPYDDLARTGNSNPSDGPANPSSRG